MASSSFLASIVYIVVISTGWTVTTAEEYSAASSEIGSRRPRHLLQSKLCFKFGLCGGGHNQGHQGGYQGGYGGYQGGYQGGYGGYQGGYPPINIGISQSQSSASAGGGGYGPSTFPNYNQYNNGYPGYNPGNFGNGFGSYNNQFNGNFYGGRPQGGYGFQGPSGNFYDEGYGDVKPVYEDQEYSRSAKSKD